MIFKYFITVYCIRQSITNKVTFLKIHVNFVVYNRGLKLQKYLHVRFHLGQRIFKFQEFEGKISG